MIILKRIYLLLLLIVVFAQSTIVAQDEVGWVKFIFNQDEIYLIADNDYENFQKISSGDSLLFRVGVHRLLMVGSNFNDYKSTVSIFEDSTVTKRMNFYIREYAYTSYEMFESNRNVAISTDDDGKIYLDGELVGTSYTELLTAPGFHKLEIKHPEYGRLSTQIEVTERNVTEVGRYNHDPTPTNGFIKILPGGSYLANEQRGKAILTYVGLIALTASAVHENSRYSDLDAKYQQQYLDYLSASSPEQAVTYRELANNTLDEMNSTNSKLTLSVLGIAAVYIATTLDGLRKPKSGYSGSSYFVPELNVRRHPVTGQSYPSLTIRGNLR